MTRWRSNVHEDHEGELKEAVSKKRTRNQRKRIAAGQRKTEVSNRLDYTVIFINYPTKFLNVGDDFQIIFLDWQRMQ